MSNPCAEATCWAPLKVVLLTKCPTPELGYGCTLSHVISQRNVGFSPLHEASKGVYLAKGLRGAHTTQLCGHSGEFLNDNKPSRIVAFVEKYSG
ncbi:hypothetical protein MTO96_028577 [Rhipicephalus appendiculatus]